eukprot:Gb_38807 [translate_table: standard]
MKEARRRLWRRTCPPASRGDSPLTRSLWKLTKGSMRGGRPSSGYDQNPNHRHPEKPYQRIHLRWLSCHSCTGLSSLSSPLAISQQCPHVVMESTNPFVVYASSRQPSPPLLAQGIDLFYAHNQKLSAGWDFPVGVQSELRAAVRKIRAFTLPFALPSGVQIPSIGCSVGFSNLLRRVSVQILA